MQCALFRSRRIRVPLGRLLQAWQDALMDLGYILRKFWETAGRTGGGILQSLFHPYLDALIQLCTFRDLLSDRMTNRVFFENMEIEYTPKLDLFGREQIEGGPNILHAFGMRPNALAQLGNSWSRRANLPLNRSLPYCTFVERAYFPETWFQSRQIRPRRATIQRVMWKICFFGGGGGGTWTRRTVSY